jgi:hypothetical protein
VRSSAWRGANVPISRSKLSAGAGLWAPVSSADFSAIVMWFWIARERLVTVTYSVYASSARTTSGCENVRLKRGVDHLDGGLSTALDRQGCAAKAGELARDVELQRVAADLEALDRP